MRAAGPGLSSGEEDSVRVIPKAMYLVVAIGVQSTVLDPQIYFNDKFDNNSLDLRLLVEKTAVSTE